MMDQDLYVILPYYNYMGWKNREENTIRFIQENIHLQKCGVKFILIEGVYRDEHRLNHVPAEIYKHIQLDVKHPIWIKENLINLAIKQLPADWQHVAWVDADIFFTNLNWHKDTKAALEVHDVVQLFSGVINVDKQGNMIENPYAQHGIVYSQNVEHGHPGHAWAMTRTFYEKIGKLMDMCIVGGADSFIAVLSMDQGNPEGDMLGKFLQTEVAKPFLPHILHYIAKFKNTKTSHVNGIIIHYYHGDVRKRKYAERQQILLHVKYNPDVHVAYGEQGVLQIREDVQHAKAFINNIKHYFLSRREDDELDDDVVL